MVWRWSEKSSVPSNNEEDDKPSMPSLPIYIEESLKSSMPTLNKKGTSSWVNLSPSNSTSFTDGQSSSKIIVSKSMDEGSVKKKRVSFEVEEMSNQDADFSKLSGVTIMSPHVTRDLHEFVAEIRDDFEIASSYGKDVANMLEVGKLPHHPGLLKVILSRVLCHSTLSTMSPSAQSVKLASKSIKLAKSYFEDDGKDENTNACDLSSTLDKLYAWERKLYKEVKVDDGQHLILHPFNMKCLLHHYGSYERLPNSAFVVVLPENTHLISKRIALGQTVLVYDIAYIKGAETEVIMHPVRVAASTAIGVVACVLALLFPFPDLSGLAFFEVKENFKLYLGNASERRYPPKKTNFRTDCSFKPSS